MNFLMLSMVKVTWKTEKEEEEQDEEEGEASLLTISFKHWILKATSVCIVPVGV